ncbi:MAG: hypothetical protein Roseis2KO_24950 [Roseivirga sp.]
MDIADYAQQASINADALLLTIALVMAGLIVALLFKNSHHMKIIKLKHSQ